MIATREFQRMTHCFLQDEFEWGVNNETEWIKKALQLTHLPPSGVRALKEFLDQLLAQSDDKVLQDVWWSTCPFIFRFRNWGHARIFDQHSATNG